MNKIKKNNLIMKTLTLGIIIFKNKLKKFNLEEG